MGFKSTILRPFAKHLYHKILRDAQNAVPDQKATFSKLISRALKTEFGKEHGFSDIKDHGDFCKRVPIRNYEGLRPFIDKIIEGKADVLWPGRPKYFAKTSGTTSGVKYIPLTKESTPLHIATARNATFNHCYLTGNMSIFDGKLIFISGSPELDNGNLIPTGRLSGIVNHEVPTWLQSSQLPSYKTNSIADWEAKLDAVIDETMEADMRMISGIPPWVQMYYEKLLERSGKDSVSTLFPNYKLFIYGGVNFEPYRNALESLVGKKLDSLETYPASEGFIAFQDQIENEGLLLNTNAGLFFEFVPLDQIANENPDRLLLKDVVLDKDYVLILSSNAGLWGYNIGDTVRFVSKDPYRVRVSGRVKHFISAFGEHVIAKEVEQALLKVTRENGLELVEFTVAPQVSPEEGLPYHEWFIEFKNGALPELEYLESAIDEELQLQNIYYKDLRAGNVLRRLKITLTRSNAFRDYMESQGKLGGQNKVPRLSNDRKIVEKLSI